MTIPAFPLTRFALSTGVSVNAVDIGPRDGEVLIFLHGFPESHRTWRHQLTHLSTRYRCIAGGGFLFLAHFFIFFALLEHFSIILHKLVAFAVPIIL